MKVLDKIIRAHRFKLARQHIAGSCLDIGCHDGSFLKALSFENKLGVDIKIPIQAREKNLVQIKLEEFNPTDSFKTVTCLATYEHLNAEDRSHFWRISQNSLPLGGRVVMTIPHRFVDFIIECGRKLKVLDGMDAHQHKEVCLVELKRSAKTHGFEVIKFKKFQFGLNRMFVFQKMA